MAARKGEKARHRFHSVFFSSPSPYPAVSPGDLYPSPFLVDLGLLDHADSKGAFNYRDREHKGAVALSSY